MLYILKNRCPTIFNTYVPITFLLSKIEIKIPFMIIDSNFNLMTHLEYFNVKY